MKIKTHTFKLGRYYIEETDRGVLGMCEVPGGRANSMYMFILSGKDKEALRVAIHEAAHAEGIPDKYLDEDRDFSSHLANFLWRLGWRRK
jgi:hypothetical protein